MFTLTLHTPRRLSAPPLRAWTLAACWLAALLLWPVTGRAQTAGLGGLEQLAREFVTPALSGATTPAGDAPLRPEVVVGTLDTRLRLAPCNKVEAHLPAGTRLWGRSRIGLRCVEGPVLWNVFLPITVKVWGPAWVVQRAVAPGAVLNEGDVVPGEVDWAEHPAPVLVRQADWLGVTAARGLMPGQVLRQNMVRPVQVFNAGTEVKVHVKQAGFQVSATGRAMGHGFLGQPVRVKMPGGRVVSGRVRRDNSVSVDM